MGLKVEIQDMDFNSLVASVGTKVDIAIAGMTVTEERKLAEMFCIPQTVNNLKLFPHVPGKVICNFPQPTNGLHRGFHA